MPTPTFSEADIEREVARLREKFATHPRLEDLVVKFRAQLGAQPSSREEVNIELIQTLSRWIVSGLRQHDREVAVSALADATAKMLLVSGIISKDDLRGYVMALEVMHDHNGDSLRRHVEKTVGPGMAERMMGKRPG